MIPVPANTFQALEGQLFGGPDNLRAYAVLDGAANPDMLAALADLEPVHCCLWLGDLAPALREVAPYLVRLRRGDGFTTYLLRHGYGRRWGVFARSAARLIDLRAHLRRLTLAQFPDGQRSYFRFYDPQVLPTLLESAHTDQLAKIYGPVEAYPCEVPEVFWASGEDHRFRTFLRPAASAQSIAEALA